MQRYAFWIAVSIPVMLYMLVMGTSNSQSPNPPNRQAMWKKVEEAVQKGLPKTAIDEIKPIIESAIAERAYPEAIKTIARRIALSGMIEGGKPEEQILQLKKEMATYPKEMLPSLNAIMGNWYWSYFEQNRWRFANRTSTSASPSEDFQTWDLKRLFQEIDKYYVTALQSEEALKSTPIQSYDALLNKGALPDSYRPTLYDFFAFLAIDFYTSAEQAGARAEDMFEIDATSAALGNVYDFLEWRPSTTDEDSPKLKAIVLYQKLLRFHQNDPDKSAFLDADLGRLRFAHANAVGDEKTSRYKAALKTFAESNARHELSATARARLAELLQSENELVEARQIALQGKNAFPNSSGGKQCANLISSIEGKGLSVMTERTWTDPYPVLRIRYRNINKVYFRVLRAEWLGRFASDRWLPNQINQTDMQQLTKQTPVLAWSADLPTTEDYREATHDAPAPTTLKPGYYFILASAREDFSDTNNSVSVSEVWVTNISLVVRQIWGAAKIDGFVLDAKTGEPISNARIRVFERGRNQRMEERQEVRTNADGFFSISGKNANLFLLASHNGNEIASINEYAIHRSNETVTNSIRHVLFTDRAIYRPGQTIFFKGICYKADTKTNEYEVVPGQEVGVQFMDSNNKEIASLRIKSNDYGSYSGTFTAPRDRGTGQMTIQVRSGQQASLPIRVEEYKRPKFQVTIDPPKEATKLGDSVTVVGKAMAYNGAAIQSAKVRYRVARQVRWPQWFMSCFFWRIPPIQGQSQEIAHGWVETAADGTFRVSFEAKPDRTVPESDSPIFQYTVTADVTDSSGETRVGVSSVSVGYVALQADIRLKDYLTSDSPINIKLKTSSLSDQAESAKGNLKIFRLKAPNEIIRSDLLGDRPRPVPRVRTRNAANVRPTPSATQPQGDPADPSTWELGEAVENKTFETNAEGATEQDFSLPVGHYRVVVETQDKYGKPVNAMQNIAVIDPKSKKLNLKVANYFKAPEWSVEPGQKFQAVWGTGYNAARAYIEIEHRGKILASSWTKPGTTQLIIEQMIDESMRGGVVVRTTMVRENRAYFNERSIDVPWSNKDLHLKWERFVSKLEPSAREKFTLTITGKDANKVTAEMVAALYDASLDAFVTHHWMNRFSVFYREYPRSNSSFQNMAIYLNPFHGSFHSDFVRWEESYRAFPPELRAQSGIQVRSYAMRGLGAGGYGAIPGAPAPAAAEAFSDSAKMEVMTAGAEGMVAANAKTTSPDFAAAPQNPTVDLSIVTTRSNLNETAFFFPQLVSNEEGVVKLEFTMPEALTKWRFLGFAHDRQLRSGYLEDSIVTSKELMVQPNPPRFMREGDQLEFSVKVTNLSNKQQSGKVALRLLDARTNQSVDAAFANQDVEKAFNLPAGESRSYFWKLHVPDGAYPVIYKAVGASEKLSDGEEGMLPVLSKRILVTESLPLPIRGKTTKEFDFKKLVESATSKTLQHQSLSVQVTSQPAWYAVLALPYLMEFPHECSEQTFNRLYANLLAQHIAKSDPKIHRVFETWRNLQPSALDSPLQKNQDVKSVMIEETPWLRAAEQESESRRNVGLLFDDNRLAEEIARATKKLAEMQRDNGMWPWFPGGPDNEYLSLYIVTGFGRLKNLKVKTEDTIAYQAIDRIDAWIQAMHDRILRESKNPDDNHLNSTVALYLYGRSFFVREKPIAAPHQKAIAYWQQQAQKYWLQLGNRQSQAHVALGLHRMGDKATSQAIVASLKERSVSNEEMGMFWRDTERSWWWYQAPIETQAMMIEAMDEVANDAAAVEECKVWLLKQKQTQNWKTTKATADAVYALLLRGNNLLSSDALVQVKLADIEIQPTNVEAGTGFYEQKFLRSEIKPDMGRIVMTKTDAGVSWGSIHWQYLEDVSKVTPYEGTPLKLEKKLFRRTLTKSGPVLEPVDGKVQVGDELVCRIVLRTDRDMEYVHLKDHRGSGTEPVNVLSHYKYQDGLAYYESTRDTASHFFIDYLPKGTYVFEYALRVQHAGNYPSGMASIQCMYAPEFNSHSASIPMDVSPQ